jgi:hypothetical protein
MINEDKVFILYALIFIWMALTTISIAEVKSSLEIINTTTQDLCHTPYIIEHNVNLNAIDDLYQVDGIRFAIVRENREMPKACMWADQSLDGKGYEVIKSNKKGFIIDLREE